VRDLKNVGGTPGGLPWFIGGLAMLAVGVYLLFQQVDVHGGYWAWGRGGSGTSFGLSLIPLLVGVGLLFFDSESRAGWILAGLGALIVIAGIIVNLRIHFRTTTLWDTILILILIAGGIGAIVRSLRPSGVGARRPRDDDDDEDLES
jgi:hypothetical protein